MSFAEIVLRLALATGGWLIFTAHALTLLALRQAGCVAGAGDPVVGTTLFAVLSGLGLIGVGQGLPWRAGLRWFALLAAALAGLAAWNIAPAVATTTIGREPLCESFESAETRAPAPSSPHPATRPERIWPILQLTILGAGILQALRHTVPIQTTQTAAPTPITRRSGGT